MRSTFQTQELYNYSKQGNLIGQLIDEVIHEDCYEMRDFFKSNDKQIDYIIDIGANIGIFTLLSSVLFPKAKKILIEPNINNVELLMDNLYGFNNAVVYNVALGDGGKYKIQFDQRWSGSDKTINNVDGDINSLTIAEIISATGEKIKMTRCNNKKDGCIASKKTRCKTHDLWHGLEQRIVSYLHSISLHDVCNHNIEAFSFLTENTISQN